MVTPETAEERRADAPGELVELAERMARRRHALP